jgi:hypothetical protein
MSWSAIAPSNYPPQTKAQFLVQRIKHLTGLGRLAQKIVQALTQSSKQLSPSISPGSTVGWSESIASAAAEIAMSAS